MADKIILTSLSKEDLTLTIQDCIREEMAKHKPKRPLSNTPPNELMTIKEAATLFSVSKVTIHSWIKKGILKPVKKGSRTYFNRNEVLKELKRPD